MRVHEHHAQDLQVTSLQADERHGFVGRKNQPCWEATVIDPRSKFLVQNALGTRTTDLAARLLFGARGRLHDPHGVVLFTDGWLPYESLFPAVFGRPFQPKRQGSGQASPAALSWPREPWTKSIQVGRNGVLNSNCAERHW
jgi:IS1 family transposase